MPLRPALSLLLAALLVAGCMNVSTTLTVRPDGGGTITERLTLNPEAARMMQSMSQAFDSTGAPQELFSEEELRAEADSVPGLALQSYTPTTRRGPATRPSTASTTSMPPSLTRARAT